MSRDVIAVFNEQRFAAVELTDWIRERLHDHVKPDDVRYSDCFQMQRILKSLDAVVRIIEDPSSCTSSLDSQSESSGESSSPTTS